MEGLGQIVAAGSNVTDKTVGTYVVYSYFGAFSEYVLIDSSRAVPVPVRFLFLCIYLFCSCLTLFPKIIELQA